MRFFFLLSVLLTPYAIADDASMERDIEMADYSPEREAELTARAEAALAIRAKLEGCEDTIPGWRDVMDSPCSWYAEDPGTRCAAADVMKSDDGAADEVCCICGGGKTTPGGENKGETEAKEDTEAKEEVASINLGCGVCEDRKKFLDALNSDCSFYDELPDVRCPLASYTENNGVSAEDACCACGGGYKEGCEGSYYIKSAATGLYLAIQKHGSRVPYVNAFGTRNILTKLDIELEGNDLYVIRSSYYGDRVICVGGDGKGVTTCGDVGRSAKWIIEADNKNGRVTIKSHSNGKYLDFIEAGQDGANYPVALAQNNYDAYTKFDMTKINRLAEEEYLDLENKAEKKNLRVA